MKRKVMMNILSGQWRWKYELINQKQFSQINEFLEDKFNEVEDNRVYSLFIEKIFSISVEVLEELKK